MKNNQMLIIKIFFIITLIFAIYLFFNNYMGYGILVLAISVASLVIIYSGNKNLNNKYVSKLKQIFRTYDSVLVESKSVPSIKDKNVILVNSIEDLIDAQIELRKPIYYFKQSSTCSFTLFDQDQALIYILKEDENLTSPIEIEIKDSKIKTDKDKNVIDSEILEEINKTTIVKLPNTKSYKVSPIRKKEEEKIEIL